MRAGSTKLQLQLFPNTLQIGTARDGLSQSILANDSACSGKATAPWVTPAQVSPRHAQTSAILDVRKHPTGDNYNHPIAGTEQPLGHYNCLLLSTKSLRSLINPVRKVRGLINVAI